MSLESMKARIGYYGGAVQQDRMIQDKWKSMLSATKYSYQAAQFTKYPEMKETVRGLFNPVTHNLNFDTKMISVGFDSGYKAGDVFRWENTKTYWICYAQDLTELAYFRGECRRCDYKIQWVNKDRELVETYISVVGPTQPDYRTNNPGYGLSIDTSTADLTVLATNNKQNKEYFHQYGTFIINGITYSVHQVNDLSLPGVLQLKCQQTRSNLIDDDVEENVTNKWNIQPVVPQYPTQYGIEGPLSIKPLFPYKFNALIKGGTWSVLENKDAKKPLPIKLDVTDAEVTVTWEKSTSGAFTLCYDLPNGTSYKRHIIVESLM